MYRPNRDNAGQCHQTVCKIEGTGIMYSTRYKVQGTRYKVQDRTQVVGGQINDSVTTKGLLASLRPSSPSLPLKCLGVSIFCDYSWRQF